MFNPTVQLRSGGYIVIGVTEALVAIDVNSGRATKEGSIEDTALKTNLEAAEEVARQLRLRDLAGLIVIDFIDMEERKNNAAVEKRLKEKLKTDRARIQVGRISGFGLLEMSRQRLRPGMLESTTAPCPHCHGTGIIRSDDNLALQILRQLEEEGTRKRSREVLLKAPVAVVNFLFNQKREHLAQIEARYGMSIRMEADPAMVSPDFSIEKFKTATRVVPDAASPVVSVDALRAADEADEDEDIVEVEDEEEAPAVSEAEPAKKKKRRRRRRRKNGGAGAEGPAAPVEASDAEGDAAETAETTAEESTGPDAAADTVDASAESPAGKAKPKRTRSRKKPAAEDAVAETAAETVSEEAVDAAPAEDKPAPKKRVSRSRSKKAAEVPVDEPAAEAVPAAADEAPKPARKSTSTRSRKPASAKGKAAAPASDEVAPEPVAAPEPAAARATGNLQPDPQMAETAVGGENSPELAADEAPKPKRRGWWSLGR